MPNHSTNCPSTFLHWLKYSQPETSYFSVPRFFSLLMQTKFFILVGNQANCDKDVGKPYIW